MRIVTSTLLREPNVTVRICSAIAWVIFVVATTSGARAEEPWRKHVVHEGLHTNTAVAGDFTKDGKPDIISNSGSKTRLFVAPNWQEVILAEGNGHDFIHSEFFDVDGDGDLDWIGARYQPGLIVWLEQPEKPLEQRWPLRLVDDQVIGVHGLLKGDIGGDGQFDLIANSAQPLPSFPNSVEAGSKWRRGTAEFGGVRLLSSPSGVAG
jgi:hypothetical protein